MKKFYTVLQFELGNYFKNRSFMLWTIILGVLISLALFLPNVIDMSEILGLEETQPSQNETEKPSEEKSSQMMIYDEAGIIKDITLLDDYFKNTQFTVVSSVDEMKKALESESVKAGFAVKSYTEFDYYVWNQGMSSSNASKFQSYLTTLNRMNYCEVNNLNYQELETTYTAPVTYNEQILGKDTRSNYWYCYVLVILVFFMIVFYGTMIATSVTTEKSNRAIEVLVTSANSNSLLFGKVIAGAISSVFQVFFILGLSLISYQINRSAWGGQLDMVLQIPALVIVTFAFFGLGGFLFYAFLYGAVGALVSKTEDVSKTTGGVMMLVMIVYFITLVQLGNTDGIAIKILSFLPISSYSAMFARVAMGNVAIWEIIVSFVILVLSILGVGIIGAKIYRMGTLRYGNPIKISHALKSLKKNNN